MSWQEVLGICLLNAMWYCIGIYRGVTITMKKNKKEQEVK